MRATIKRNTHSSDTFGLSYTRGFSAKTQRAIELTCFVSCYNESELIVKTLEDIVSALSQIEIFYEIIIIDDCSVDASVIEIEKFMTSHDELAITLCTNIQNRGLSENYFSAAHMARGRFFKLFCGDNTEPIASIKKIIQKRGQADIVVPYYKKVEGKGFVRQLLSKIYTFLVNVISGHKIPYYNGLHLHKTQNILLLENKTKGFAFQAQILCTLLNKGVSYVTVEVNAVEKKPSGAITTKNVFSVLKMLLIVMAIRLSKH